MVAPEHLKYGQCYCVSESELLFKIDYGIAENVRFVKDVKKFGTLVSCW
jgi:uncharacterized membrane protein